MRRTAQPDLAIAAALAVALTVVLGGPAVMKWGLMVPLVPIGLRSLSLVALGVAFHALTRRSYRHRPPQAGTVAPQAALPAMFSAPDIDEALAQMGDSFDIAREDLDRLLHCAEASALRRQARSS